MKRDDIALLCNPRAGGRWKELAKILDSSEAQHVRRIVTDQIEDINLALSELGKRVKLLCIYGGDGTIQKIIDEIYRNPKPEYPTMAFVGGGTMNVTTRWSGFTGSAKDNFCRTVRNYRTDQLVTRDVPLLQVRQGDNSHYGFTFGMGPLIRILNEYENGPKGIPAALQMAGKSMFAVWTGFPESYRRILAPMRGSIIVDGQTLPYTEHSVMFCNTTGSIHIGMRPFIHDRTRESFFFAAYAISKREVVVTLPFIARGKLPIDPKALLKPVSTWKQLGLGYFGKNALPIDPRYLNGTAHEIELNVDERFYTLDGEILPLVEGPLHVGLGPAVRLAVEQ